MGNLIRSLFSAPGLRKEIHDRRSRLYRLAYSWCHDTAVADDLAQEALTKALRKGNQLRESENLDRWLFRILANCWKDHLRRSREFVNVDDVVLEHDASPEHLYGTNEIVSRVRAAVAKLPNGQRQVLMLIDLEGVSYANASEILGIPVGTVMSRISRARNALKTLLEQQETAAAHPTRLHRIK